MTKEEFLKIITDELDDTYEMFEEINKRVNYFKSIGVDYVIKDIYSVEELEDAKHYALLAQERIKSLMELVDYPMIARINAMSEAEIEEYRKEKLQVLDCEIENIKKNLKDVDDKLFKLLQQRENIIKRFSPKYDEITIDSREMRIQERFTDQGKEIQRKIVSIKQEEIRPLKEKLEEVIKQQEELKNMSLVEIKKMMVEKLENGSKIQASRNHVMETKLVPCINLLTSVVDDYEKTTKLEGLIKHYVAAKEDVYSGVVFDSSLPAELINLLNASFEKFHDISKLYKILEEYMKLYSDKKSSFIKEVTEAKVKEAGEKLPTISNINELFSKDRIDFLESYEPNKLILGDKLTRFKNLIDKYKELDNKIFHFGDTKKKIGDISTQIYDLYVDMYKRIVQMYVSKLSGMEPAMSFSDYHYSCIISDSSLEYFKENLSFEIEKNFEICEKAMTSLKEALPRMEEELKEKQRDLPGQLHGIENQINELVGKENAITNFDNIADYNVAQASGISFASKMVMEVDEEAQTQSLHDEANLRGITVNELLKLREQAIEAKEKILSQDIVDAPPKL